MPDNVRAAFDVMPVAERALLKDVRAQIFEVANSTEAGPLTETLKWGQPSYLTEFTKAGSTVRLGLHKGQAAVFFNCQTTLVDGFRNDFPEAFRYEGNRALLLHGGHDLNALQICIARALTYHWNKKARP